MVGTFSVFILCFASQLVWGFRPEKADRSVLEECRWNATVVDLKVDCNELYQHYYPLEDQVEEGPELRIGSYNIFRLSEQKQKRLDLNAEMINSEWDLVAVNEMQPNLSHQKLLSDYAVSAFQAGNITSEEFRLAYFKPSYLLLLLELQKRDPSWGFVVSSYSQGSDSEIFGFLYRARRVQPTQSEYCRRAYTQSLRLEIPGELDQPLPENPVACPLQLSGLAREHFSKVPWVGRFKSGSFESSLMALHLRFRADGEFNSRCVEACQEINRRLFDDMMSALDDGELIRKVTAAVKPSEEWGREKSRENQRFFEAWTAAKTSLEIRELENNKSIILAGDFNLDYRTNQSWQAQMWRAIKTLMDGAQVLIDGPTSVSERSGLSNNYDHFILNTEPGHADTCETSTATIVDFLDPQLVLSNGYQLGAALASYRDSAQWPSLTEFHLMDFDQQLWVNRSGQAYTHQDYVQLPLTADAREFQAANQRVCSPEEPFGIAVPWMNYHDQMIAALGCKMFHNPYPYAIPLYAMSDHVPISLTCRTR